MHAEAGATVPHARQTHSEHVLHTHTKMTRTCNNEHGTPTRNENEDANNGHCTPTHTCITCARAQITANPHRPHAHKSSSSLNCLLPVGDVRLSSSNLRLSTFYFLFCTVYFLLSTFWLSAFYFLLSACHHSDLCPVDSSHLACRALNQQPLSRVLL